MNLLGIGARSISSENGDRAAIRKARLIASMEALWCSRVPPVILILGDHDRATANDSADGVVPVVAGVTLGNAIGLGIVAY